MSRIRKSFLLLPFFLFISGIALGQSSDFIKVSSTHFERNGKPYYFIGTNFWYGAILGSKGEGGDRKRLKKELDFLSKKGISNLRILVGADGPNGVPTKVEPTLQTAPGVYNDTILDGLDYLMKELNKRKMVAVLYLTNSWEWSGGFGQYLAWNGYGDFPILNYIGWEPFKAMVNKFHECEPCKQQLRDHIKFIIARTNRYTGKKYVDDPAIMSWQIANEPRAFADKQKPAYEKWISETASLIKSLDHNHLVSTGSEGEKGAEEDIGMYERIHTDKNVDYLTFHVWPKNWSWINPKDIAGTVDKGIDLTKEYMAKHIAIAEKLGKPIVMSEFGLPRDGHSYSLSSTTTLRDRYYDTVFSIVVASAQKGGALAGCNFWAWGGFARATEGHKNWAKGDEYMGDPAQEEQGLNSVFNTDSTVNLVERRIKELKK
nr:cellulase family glycosylhydrolase [uncultured Acetobacteroides sp.]